MSILCIQPIGCLINHQTYYSQIEVISDGSLRNKVKLLPKLFCIVKPELFNHKVNKRKRKHSNYSEESDLVKQFFQNFVEEIPEKVIHSLSLYNTTDTAMVRKLSQQLFESTIFNHKGIRGGNNSSEYLKCKVLDNYFLIPPFSRFYCGCVTEECKKLEGVKYNLIIADPPWWNKYIRRLKKANSKASYPMMCNEDIASVPIKRLRSEKCIIAMWCTNSPSNIKAVKELIFPSWGVEYKATWYWMKVTTSLEPVNEFNDELKKQPYERIMFGVHGDVKDIPDNYLLVSVPSALHSHKPPLSEILASYYEKESLDILELFARYLMPHTTSIGFEPLKWQHESLFEEVE